MTNSAPKTPLGKKLLAIRNRAIANGMQLKTEEEIMTNDKWTATAGAPTPDEVDKSLSNVACECADYLDAQVIRTHIAALEHKHDDLVTRCVQAESDRDALEAKLAEQIREDEMRLINHCVKIVGNNSKAHIHAEAEFLTKIAELEAENKRLRNAAEKYRGQS